MIGADGRLEGSRVANYHDATIFENSTPHGTANGRYIGGILKGICYDTQKRRMEYWQTKPRQSQPVQLPAGRILIIKDRRSCYVDGESYLRASYRQSCRGSKSGKTSCYRSGDLPPRQLDCASRSYVIRRVN